MEYGQGIGLASVKAVAEKYHGVAQFSVNERQFISKVMLKTNSE